MISDKTASLMAATCELGALTSNVTNKNHITNLKKFGEFLGIAFQIKDDLLDFTSTEKTLGKPIAKDLIENIITLPLLYGLKNSDNHHQTKILDMLKKGIQEQEVNIIRNFAKESGGIEYALRKAEYFTGKALEGLNLYEGISIKFLTDFLIGQSKDPTKILNYIKFAYTTKTPKKDVNCITKATEKIQGKC